jgi:hypothetical protein
MQHSPEKFKTVALSRKFETREEALSVEHRLQTKLNVVKNPLYVNQSTAAKNGCFGRDVSGHNHPLFGVGHSQSSRKKISENHADVSGAKNGRARWFRFTAPSGEVFEVFGGFNKFCIERGLPRGTMLHVLYGRTFEYGKCAGWKCERI